MKQHQFYTQAAKEPVYKWPQWIVVTECGSSYFFTREEAQKEKSVYESEGVKCQLEKAEFV